MAEATTTGAGGDDLGGLAGAELGGGLRLEEAVDAGRTAAETVRIDLHRLVAARTEDVPRSGEDSLGVAEVAGVLDGDRSPTRSKAREGPGGDELGDELGDVADGREAGPVVLEVRSAAGGVGDKKIASREGGGVDGGEASSFVGVAVVGSERSAARLGGGNDDPVPGPGEEIDGGVVNAREPRGP